MSPEAIVTVIGAIIGAIGAIIIAMKKLPKRIKSAHFTKKWRDLQKLCAKQETWPEAIVSADKMLDDVLKKRRKPGKSMGERLVEAQKSFTNNDAVWKAHKLANHINHSGDDPKLKEKDVKEALVSFRQALRDLGAL